MIMTATTNRGAAICMEAATKKYGDFMALDNISLKIEAGEFMTFLGPSGSGKTTTLNLIAGFTNLSSGTIKLGEQSIDGVPSHLRNIGVVFQHYALFPHMNVTNNVAYPLKLRGFNKKQRNEKITKALNMVKLAEFAQRYPGELSGGQQQRVALARAMVFDPPLLLMDEPLGALDKKLREWLQMEIKRIHRELGTTFVYVTHDQEEALVLSDRIAIFNHGRIEQIGTGKNLYDNPSTLFVGQFIGESTILRGKNTINAGKLIVKLGEQTVMAPLPEKQDKNHVVLIRPEKISLLEQGSAAPAGHNILNGTIVESIYMGSGTKYDVMLADGSTLIARSPLTDSIFKIGDCVEAIWSIADCHSLPEEIENPVKI